MEEFKELITKFREVFNQEIFKLGQTPITLITVINIVLITLIFYVLSRVIRRFLRRRILPGFRLADGAQFVVLRLIHFVLMTIGFLIALNSVNIQLTSLTVLFGLVGVGIAFGLQNITSNFVSGIILLFERPINVGDYVEVGDVIGRVQAINIRATTIVTLDNITLIVPNSQFIESTVTNWSVGDPKIRLNIPVGVAYGSDTELVTRILRQTAEEHKKVLKEPEPDVLFKEFGDSSLNFELRVWIPNTMLRPKTISEINYAIDEAFRKNSVTIPFPQRDVHFFRED
jgi:small-conductance mechanosensitive channel